MKNEPRCGVNTERLLSNRIDRLERLLRFSAVGWLALFGVILFSAWKPAPNVQISDNLKLRQLTIVDEKGVERIYIGSPVPDAMGPEGKRITRQKPSTGIVFNNTRGEEMSGWGVFDDESQNLCFDYKGAERLCLLQAGERAGLVVKDGDGRFLSMLGRIGFNDDTPKLILNDLAGRTRIRLHASENGTAVLELLDEKGKRVPIIGDSSSVRD